MREILFRAKTVDDNCWHYGDIFHSSANPSQTRIHDYENHVNFEAIEDTLGQYTGLTDEKGVKIFEGDIVRIYCDYDSLDGFSKTAHDDFLVKWDNDKLSFIFCAVYPTGEIDNQLSTYVDNEELCFCLEYCGIQQWNEGVLICEREIAKRGLNKVPNDRRFEL